MSNRDKEHYQLIIDIAAIFPSPDDWVGEDRELIYEMTGYQDQQEALTRCQELNELFGDEIGFYFVPVVQGHKDIKIRPREQDEEIVSTLPQFMWGEVFFAPKEEPVGSYDQRGVQPLSPVVEQEAAEEEDWPNTSYEPEPGSLSEEEDILHHFVSEEETTQKRMTTDDHITEFAQFLFDQWNDMDGDNNKIEDT